MAYDQTQFGAGPIPTPNIPKNSSYVFTPQLPGGVTEYMGPAYSAGYQPPSSWYQPPTPTNSGASGSWEPVPPTPTPVNNINVNDPMNGFDMKYYAGWDPEAARQDWLATGGSKANTSSGGSFDPYAQVRNDINSGYNSYFSQLDSILNNDLPSQYGNQNQIISNSYNQAVNDLGTQNTIGQNELQGQRTEIIGQQKKSLKDVAENVRNMFTTGQVMLGTRGAGDSSAANQYSYALTKLGTKARTNVLNQSNMSLDQVRQREFRLGETYRSELSRLQTERDNSMLEIAQWLAGEQSKLRQMRANGELSRSTDLANLSKSLLDQALSALQTTNTAILNRKGQLETWAMNQSTNIAELKKNLAGISTYTAPQINTPVFGGTPTFSGGNITQPIYWSYQGSNEKDKELSRLGA